MGRHARHKVLTQCGTAKNWMADTPDMGEELWDKQAPARPHKDTPAAPPAPAKKATKKKG